MRQTTLSIFAEDFALHCPHCGETIDEIHVTRLYELMDIECPECFERSDLTISLGQ